MCKCRSHGTFPLFGLQSSHLNICYYHQDLYRRPLRPGSRLGFCNNRRALLLIEAWYLPQRLGIVLLTKNGPLGALDSVNSPMGSSYPEGNFGGNQLLDGSISLSPLYPSQTNDLHISIAAGLHQSFLWLRPAQA
ncbi:hypothetical protein RJT34_21491 [Clitoria ternatea]|uniref:Uncharacterized protein n=1 Tax=Clitoria ternatea TaxID=43366 RepID=A0AAN9IVE4_CLITE